MEPLGALVTLHPGLFNLLVILLLLHFWFRDSCAVNLKLRPLPSVARIAPICTGDLSLRVTLYLCPIWGVSLDLGTACRAVHQRGLEKNFFMFTERTGFSHFLSIVKTHAQNTQALSCRRIYTGESFRKERGGSGAKQTCWIGWRASGFFLAPVKLGGTVFSRLDSSSNNPSYEKASAREIESVCTGLGLYFDTTSDSPTADGGIACLRQTLRL